MRPCAGNIPPEVTNAMCRRGVERLHRGGFDAVQLRSLGQSLLPRLKERTDALTQWVMRRRLHRESGFGPATGSVGC